jgi:tRNA (Thr-GGU) A37 N-methylase
MRRGRVRREHLTPGSGISRRFAGALPGINIGEEIIVLTWVHQARRDVQKVHPRGN